MKARILPVLFVAAALLVLSAGPIAAAFPSCFSASYCASSPNCPCTCNFELRWFSTCGEGCELLPLKDGPQRPQGLADVGIPGTVLDQLGVVAYAR